VTGITSAGPKAFPDSETVAYAMSSGTKLWAARYGAEYPDVTGGIAASPDSSLVFVTGWSGSASCAQQSTTIAYNAT
jgi:hypothetical protein